MLRRFWHIVTFLAGMVLIPAFAHAQGSIAGIVKDASGAVLPGVTVEASSAALIERVRSAVTDGTGQYKIVDLRPGTYSVSFTLEGFSTFKREGIELTGSFVASVNAELKVGAVAETVTVTGETPIVDVQSARQQQVLSQEVINAIPSSRLYSGLAVLVPGILVTGSQDVGGLAGPAVITFSIHGGPANEGRLSLDGLSIGAALNGAGSSYYVPDVGNSQEAVFSTAGGLGEIETGGPAMNIVPRQGGNSVRGSLFATGANDSMQSSNYTQELKDKGLRAANQMTKIWDINGALGGPVQTDRLWYFLTTRYQGNRKLVAGMFYNKNAGNLASWTYDPDLDRQATDDGTWKNAGLRLTWQASPRNKVSFFWDEQRLCISCLGGGSATTSPEASGQTKGWPDRVQQAAWTSPVTNRLLLEAGVGTFLLRWGGNERPNNNRAMIPVNEQAGSIPGLNYRAGTWFQPWSGTHTWRASATYVTGAQSVKVGYLGGLYDNRSWNFQNDAYLSYRFSNGLPNQVTISGGPFQVITHTWPTALFAQDQWTIHRLTLSGGLRYDHVQSEFPEQQVGPTRNIPTALVFPGQQGVSFNDLTPRIGAAYDLFGHGRTALKVTLGKFLAAADGSSITGAQVNPLSRIATSTTRSWNDNFYQAGDPRRGNFTPDCDLLNPAQNAECGPMTNQTFGRNAFINTYDPAILSGWGVRSYDWNFGAQVQQELAARVSVNVGYFRRVFGNFFVTDNLAVAPSDYSPFSVTVPADSRLPSSGATISGLFDVNPLLFGQVNNLITTSNRYGNQIQRWNGVDVNVSARQRGGLTVQGGLSSGRTVTDNCEIRALVPEVGALNPYCHVENAVLTQIKGLGSYSIRSIGVFVSGTFQSTPGPQLAANYNVPNAVIAPSLGRSLSGGSANASVNLVAPGTFYGDRINQLDFRAAKILKIGRTRSQVSVDLYNALNSGVIQTYNQTFIPGGAWLTPTLILPARFAKVSVQVDF